MSKEICISSTPHETRLAILEDDQLTEVYYERENEYTLAGSIYKGRVTRVLPGMQSAFVDLGLERDAFLYVTDFLEEQEDSAEFERLSGGGQEERSGREQAGRDTQSTHAAEGASSPKEGKASGPADEFQEGTRRWRGRRGRRNRSYQPQGSQPELQEAPRTQPAAAPEPAERVREDEVASNQSAQSNQDVPFYLPGESLSKYGGRSSAGAAETSEGIREPQQRAAFAPKPSTLIESPIEWSGAGLLPGESLSRYRGVTEESPQPSNTRESAASIEAPVEGAEERVPRGTLGRADVEQQPDEGKQGVEGAQLPGGAALSSIEPGIEPSIDSGIEPQRTSEPVTALVEPLLVEEFVEFDPEDASASYRVDPSAPSEFRIASPVAAPDESEVESEDESEAAEEEESFPSIPEFESHLSAQMRHEEPPIPEAGAFPEEPQFFSAQGSALDAVQDEESDEEENLEGLAEEINSSTGLLEEEEVSEEEEYEFTPFYGHFEDHDLEEMEEHTLDPQAMAGAEIDDLVRDTHIDQRIDADASALEIDEPDEEVLDEEIADADSEVETEGAAAPSTAGQPARRGRQDHRRGGRGGRHDGRRRHNGQRPTAQTSSLPIISELLKQGQEILVQIAKEPIAKKGARITSHIALPGRFLVFMPTVNHVGVSRKISSDEERQRLKRILISEKGAGGGGFIVRTAADGAGEDDLRADIRFLISLWNEIKQRADAGKAPALIYHDLNLVERILRDQVSNNFSTIWVDNEVEYERIVRFLNRFQPSLVRRVKLYTKETPLFEQFGIQEEIGRALKSKVWLKSGGSIVINQTEALVAIDINTGKFVGKTARLEDTILKTNLDAIPEIVRQIRLRDLGGIIVIDFIDMDERKNRHKVMQALEEALKADRAPSKVLQFNDFGLVAITRKRVKQSLERTLCVQCTVCAGTGMTKSPTTVCNEIFVEMRKMRQLLEHSDVLLRVHPEVVKALKANNARWLSELEEITGKTVIVKSDPALHPEQFDIQ